MIGGRVIEIVPHGHVLWINCQDIHHGQEQCAIHVQSDFQSLKVQVGDNLWWQGPRAYWGPKSIEVKAWLRLMGQRASDVPLVKVGYSGVKRPQ